MGVAGNRVVLCSRCQEIVDFGRTSQFRTGGVGYVKVNKLSYNYGQNMGSGQERGSFTCECLNSRVSKLPLPWGFLCTRTYEDENNDQDHDSVNVVSKKGRFNSSRNRVEYNANR